MKKNKDKKEEWRSPTKETNYQEWKRVVVQPNPSESNRIQPYKVFPRLPGEGC